MKNNTELDPDATVQMQAVKPADEVAAAESKRKMRWGKEQRQRQVDSDRHPSSPAGDGAFTGLMRAMGGDRAVEVHEERLRSAERRAYYAELRDACYTAAVFMLVFAELLVLARAVFYIWGK